MQPFPRWLPSATAGSPWPGKTGAISGQTWAPAATGACSEAITRLECDTRPHSAAPESDCDIDSRSWSGSLPPRKWPRPKKLPMGRKCRCLGRGFQQIRIPSDGSDSSSSDSLHWSYSSCSRDDRSTAIAHVISPTASMRHWTECHSANIAPHNPESCHLGQRRSVE
jgi:hypothetical protein